MKKTTTFSRKLPALLISALVGSVALASSASAQKATFPGHAPPGQAASAPAATPGAAAGTAQASLLEVEQKLAALKYDVGPVDGQSDDQTGTAIMAFQKSFGLERTGTLTPTTASQLATTQSPPAPLVPNGEPNRVEVSLSKQVLFLYKNGSLEKILPVSTGTAETPTPTGEFRFYRSESGWHTSRLGRLYNAQYFVGGYAMHGSMSVPAEPASHGCVRLPMSAAEWFPGAVSKGMQVVIVG